MLMIDFVCCQYWCFDKACTALCLATYTLIFSLFALASLISVSFYFTVLCYYHITNQSMKDYHCPQHFHLYFVFPLYGSLYVHSFKSWRSISVFIDYSLVYSNSLLASLNARGMMCGTGDDIQIISDQNISLSSFGKSISAVCTLQLLIYWILTLLLFFCILECWTQHWCS